MHPTFKWVCQQLTIIKSCIFVLQLQSLQNNFLPFKGLLGGGFWEVRGLYLHVSTQTWSLWHDTEHYELLHTLAMCILPYHCIQKPKDRAMLEIEKPVAIFSHI